MSELERAHRLARAIDELLRGREPELEDEELAELLQIAKLRHQAARDTAGLARQYQDFIWARLEARIMQMLDDRGQKPNGMATERGGGRFDAATKGTEKLNPDHLRDVISARHQLSAEMTAMAEAYRDVVWQRVEARIEARQAKKDRRFSPFRFFFSRRKEQEEAAQLTKAIDDLILGEPIWEAPDSRLNDLVRLARSRRSLSNLWAASAAPYQDLLWARLRRRLEARAGRAAPRAATTRSLGIPWPKLAAVAAGLATIAFALGPLPATGLADHPFTQVVRFAGHLVGVAETEAPLPAAPATGSVEGTDVSLAEAQELTGLPLREPSYLPPGFEKVASRYFPRSITSDHGNMFELAYATAGSEGPLLVWQERATGNEVAVQDGFAQPVTLAGGVPGTYFQGMWRVEGEEVVWGATGAQTVLFDAGGLRTVILYLDDSRMDIQELLAVANSLLAAD